jgi:hypothetical protein
MSIRTHAVALENRINNPRIANNQEKIHDAFLFREDHVLFVVTIIRENNMIKIYQTTVVSYIVYQIGR